MLLIKQYSNRTPINLVIDDGNYFPSYFRMIRCCFLYITRDLSKYGAIS